MDMQLMVKTHLAGHDSKSHILYIYQQFIVDHQYI